MHELDERTIREARRRLGENLESVHRYVHIVSPRHTAERCQDKVFSKLYRELLADALAISAIAQRLSNDLDAALGHNERLADKLHASQAREYAGV